MNRKPQTHKRMVRKKRPGIPVQPPKAPSSFGGGSSGVGSYVSPPEVPMMYQRMKQQLQHQGPAPPLPPEKKTGLGPLMSAAAAWKGGAAGASNEMLLQEDESSIDVSSPRDNNSPIFGVVPKGVAVSKEELKRQKEDEKMEKRRVKEDAARMRKLLEKEKEQDKKNKRKSKQNSKASSNEGGAAQPTLPELIQSDKNYIPLFLEKCVQFIELEGLDSEGIYRVPGNRAHVDLLYQKFEDGKKRFRFH